jgi:hypothetical protein
VNIREIKVFIGLLLLHKPRDVISTVLVYHEFGFSIMSRHTG